MLDYSALAALAAVVREGSFERAAAALGITPSAVSQRVRSFEERVGSILVVRAQPCTPTDLGRQLCAHFERVMLLEGDLAPGLAPSVEQRALKVAVNADSLATWFPRAAATFARETGLFLDLALDDEAHTADRLRAGEVLAAVTADPDPVQGCRTTALGVMRYLACASPDYMRRHFPTEVSVATLAAAPYLRFDRRDELQARWARAAFGVELRAPVHWVPSTQGFLDFTLAGIGWGLHPVSLARPHIEAGRLVELPPCRPLDIKLFWTVTRLHAGALRSLSAAVRAAAAKELSDG